MATKNFKQNECNICHAGCDTESISSLSSSCLTRRSIIAQSGRSMVEMLGTLAIIGVLSIGGIMGYSYGMDKYRANETINDVMLLGVDVITQASRTAGMPNLSAELGTKTTVGYDFTVVQNPEDETQYGIQISGVPARVCKMVGDALKPMASVYVNDDEHITEEDPCDESDKNTMEFYFDTGAVETDGCKTDADCGEGRYCDMDTGICFRGDKPEGSHGVCTTTNECCTAGQFPYTTHGDDCSTDTIANGMCYYGTCIAKGCTYDKNQCTGKTYCASPNDSCTEAFPSGKTGTCVEADFAKLDVGDKTYYVSHHYMSWWDADAACKALGRDGLVEVDDLITGWNGGYDWVNHELTTLGTALQNHFRTGHEYIWTNNFATNSCDAYRVGADDGRVDDGDRNYYNHTEYPSYAVCR